MKRAVKIILFMCSWSVLAQENSELVYSVYFTADSFGSLKKVPSLSSSLFGSFVPEDSDKNAMRRSAGEVLKIDETGIYLEKNKLLFITREQVREEGRYEVRDGYIFGVVTNDSLPTALEGEKYYFLLPSKTYIWETGSPASVLYDGVLSGQYFLAQYEDVGYFSVIMLQLTRQQVEMKELTFGTKDCSPDTVKKHEILTGDFNTYILSPTFKEWEKIAGCFVSYDRFITE